MRNQSCSLGVLVVLLGAMFGIGEESERPTEPQRAEHLARMKDVAASIRLLDDPRRMDSAVMLVANL